MLNGAAYWLVAVTYLQTAVTPCRKSDIPLPVASCAAGSLGHGWLSNWCPLTPLHWDAPAWQVLAAGGDVLGEKKVWSEKMPEYNILEKRPSKSFQKVNWGGVLLDIKNNNETNPCEPATSYLVHASVMLWKQTELLHCMSRVEVMLSKLFFFLEWIPCVQHAESLGM